MRQSILVTGSSRGLGFAIAKMLVKHGCFVVINGKNKKNLLNAFDILGGSANCIYFEYDMLKEDSVAKLIDFITKEGVSLNGVVHNLGGKFDGDLHPIDLAILKKTMRLNLEVAIEINNFLLEYFEKEGIIVHISSTASFNANSSPCYAISKGALNNYIKNSARYYVKKNILICGVAPHIMDHPGSDWDKKRKINFEYYSKRKSEMPLGRFAKPDEIAEFVVSIFKLKNMQMSGEIFRLAGAL
jgi:NAD(P)-dependent dehydrogenase (short-subunit alcohol dehydrogenase family)